MNKKILTSIGVVTGFVVLSTALMAGAQTTTTAANTTDAAASVSASVRTQPQMLNVNKEGKVLLRGTIASIGSGVITVNGWGGVWTVNVPSSASVLPASAANNLAQFKVGDYVGVLGTVSTSASWTVDASTVRDWNFRAAVQAEKKANEQTARGIRSEAPRDYAGTASNVSASGLTVTGANGTAYTVGLASNAEIVNRNWGAIAVTDIQSGDNVRVYGMNASGTITARIIRDVTLAPVKKASSTTQ